MVYVEYINILTIWFAYPNMQVILLNERALEVPILNDLILKFLLAYMWMFIAKSNGPFRTMSAVHVYSHTY